MTTGLVPFLLFVKSIPGLYKVPYNFISFPTPNFFKSWFSSQNFPFPSPFDSIFKSLIIIMKMILLLLSLFNVNFPRSHDISFPSSFTTWYSSPTDLINFSPRGGGKGRYTPLIKEFIELPFRLSSVVICFTSETAVKIFFESVIKRNICIKEYKLTYWHIIIRLYNFINLINLI